MQLLAQSLRIVIMIHPLEKAYSQLSLSSQICVNDDLVTKRFACYSSVLARTGEQNEVVDRSPAILACDIFADTDTFLATKGCTIRTLSPRRDTSTLPLGK